MKKNSNIYKASLGLTLIFSFLVGFSQNVSFAPYPAPQTTEVFAPGIISNNYFQRDFVISPDGKLLIYSHVISRGGKSVLVSRTIANGEWSLPEILPFSGVGAYDIEPAFNPDGSELYFASNRTGSRGFDIWVATINSDGSWGDAKNLGSPVNSAANEFYPSMDSEGRLYFTAELTGGVGGEDIWFSQKIDGEFGELQLPEGNLNSALDEFNSYITPDGNTMIFSSFGQSDGRGGGDIYSSRKINNVWSTPSNRGASVNSAQLDYCPFVTNDGQYLFFTSERSTGTLFIKVDDVLDVAGVAEIMSAPSQSNNYWRKF